MQYFQKSTFNSIKSPIKVISLYVTFLVVLSMLFLGCSGENPLQETSEISNIKSKKINEIKKQIEQKYKQDVKLDIPKSNQSLNKLKLKNEDNLLNINTKETSENKNVQEDFIISMKKHVIPLSIGITRQITTSQFKLGELENLLHKKNDLLDIQMEEIKSKISSSKKNGLISFFKKKDKIANENKKCLEGLPEIFFQEGLLLDTMQKLYVQINIQYINYITTSVTSDDMFYSHLLAYGMMSGCLTSLNMAQSLIKSNYNSKIELSDPMDILTEIEPSDQKDTLKQVAIMVIAIIGDLNKFKKQSNTNRLSQEDLKSVHGGDDHPPVYLDTAIGLYEYLKVLSESKGINLVDVKSNEIEVALLEWIAEWARHTKDPNVKKKDLYAILNILKLMKNTLQPISLN